MKKRVLLVFLIVAVAFAISAKTPTQVNAATNHYYNVYIYRDPSLSSSIYNSYLVNIVNSARYYIDAAVSNQSGGAHRVYFNVYGPYTSSKNYANCETPGGSDFSGYSILFRMDEYGYNGINANAGSWSMVDLRPRTTCGSNPIDYANWPDIAAVTHELAHAFNADQDSYQSSGICVMDAYDAARGNTAFCSQDAQKMLDWVKTH